MKITFFFTGKTKIPYIEEGIRDYFSRLKHYNKFEIKVIPDVKNTKNMTKAEQMKREGEAILKEISGNEILILLDENGKKYSSVEFSGFLNRRILEGRDICMIIGGPFGFWGEVIKKSRFRISLSAMTFSHQMVRMILLEQVYRAFTIIKGEPYHHS